MLHRQITQNILGSHGGTTMLKIFSMNVSRFVTGTFSLRLMLSLAVLLLGLSSTVSATPITHNFNLLDTTNNMIYTGTVVIDDSLLTANNFISFSDSGFISFALTIGTESWTLADAFNPSSEGVITDSSGDVFSFFDNTVQTTVLLINGNGIRLSMLENNGNWSAGLNGVFLGNGPSYSFSTGGPVLNPVPEPGTLALLLLGVLGMRYSARKR